MTDEHLEATIDRRHVALAQIIKGDSEPWGALFSRRDDVTLGNPFGPFVRGWSSVVATAAAAAGHYRDGQIIGFERVGTYASNELACIAEIERFRAKVGSSEEMDAVALRVTSTFRFENGKWMLVHRHADPIIVPQSARSVIQA
jgi:SnoaL-like domain